MKLLPNTKKPSQHKVKNLLRIKVNYYIWKKYSSSTQTEIEIRNTSACTDAHLPVEPSQLESTTGMTPITIQKVITNYCTDNIVDNEDQIILQSTSFHEFIDIVNQSKSIILSDNFGHNLNQLPRNKLEAVDLSARSLIKWSNI